MVKYDSSVMLVIIVLYGLIKSLCRFTFKVVVEIEEAPDMILECFGSPHAKKKEAAEHAAEGALWFLTKGYTGMAG